jgi:hypothetical protein
VSQVLDLPATIHALQDSGIDTAAALMRDPNPRRIIEALCVRHEIQAIYKAASVEGSTSPSWDHPAGPLFTR